VVVECIKCATRFHLDPARIPDVGIRVRCSRCKHAFFLEHPGRSQTAALRAVVAEAVHNEADSLPGTTHDLSAAATRTSIGSPTLADAGDPLDGFDEEDDWEFNQDLPSHDDDPDDDLASEGFPAEALGQDSSASLSVDLASGEFSSETDRGASAALDARETTTDDSAPASLVDEVVAPSGDTSATDVACQPQIASEPQLESSQEGLASVEGVRESAFGSVDDFSSLMESDDPEQGIALGEEEAADDPENWDFFADSLTQEVSEPAPAAAPIEDRPAAASRRDRVDFEDASVVAAWPTLDAGGPVRASVRIFSALAWIAVVGLITAGVWLGFVDSFDPSVRAPAFVRIGTMRAANVRGHGLETANAGTVFVVTGDLLNPGTLSAAPALALQVSLLGGGGDGEVLSTAFAGRDLVPRDLRELTVAALGARLNTAANALVGGRIAPASSVRFTAVFMDLPDRATHFRLEAADPSSLQQPSTTLLEAPAQFEAALAEPPWALSDLLALGE